MSSGILGATRILHSHRLWIIGGVLVCALLVFRSYFRFILVVGESMQPGLSTGNLLLIDKRVYGSANPQRGDIVLARYRRELIVKRVVGLPGENVRVSEGHLFIDEMPFRESYALEPGPLEIGRGRLLAGKYALLGDNRALALEQLVFAVVPKEQIVGKVVLSLGLKHLTHFANAGFRAGPAFLTRFFTMPKARRAERFGSCG